MNKKKKITILVCTLFMVFSLGACGKTKEDAVVVTQQESSLQIESMDEETTSEESTTFNNGEEDRKNETYEFMKTREHALNAGCMINNYAPATFGELVKNNKDF